MCAGNSRLAAACQHLLNTALALGVRHTHLEARRLNQVQGCTPGHCPTALVQVHQGGCCAPVRGNGKDACFLDCGVRSSRSEHTRVARAWLIILRCMSYFM